MCTSMHSRQEGAAAPETQQAQLKHLAVTASDFQINLPDEGIRTHTVYTSQEQIADCWPEQVWDWSERCGVRARGEGLEW